MDYDKLITGVSGAIGNSGYREREDGGLILGRDYKKARFPDVETGYRFWLAKEPIRMYPGFPLPHSVRPVDRARMLDCVQYLQAETNMLFYKIGGQDMPIPPATLGRRLGMNQRETYRFLKRMIDAGIMARDEGRLYVNPMYFFRGIRLKSHLFFLFEDDLTRILPAWVVEKFTGQRPG